MPHRRTTSQSPKRWLYEKRRKRRMGEASGKTYRPRQSQGQESQAINLKVIVPSSARRDDIGGIEIVNTMSGHHEQKVEREEYSLWRREAVSCWSSGSSSSSPFSREGLLRIEIISRFFGDSEVWLEVSALELVKVWKNSWLSRLRTFMNSFLRLGRMKGGVRRCDRHEIAFSTGKPKEDKN